jgi:hypothetical protein
MGAIDRADAFRRRVISMVRHSSFAACLICACVNVLAITTVIALSVSVTLRAQSHIRFQSVRFELKSQPRGIVAADFDGDGHLDFATVSAGRSNELNLFLGGPPFRLSDNQLLANGPFGIAAVDLRHSGRADVVVTTADANLMNWWLWMPRLFAVGGVVTENPREIIGGDFDRDGEADVVWTSYQCGCVEVMLGGPGHSGLGLDKQTIPAGKGAHGLAKGDFNLDGIDDLVVTNALANSVAVLYGVGDGSFAQGASVGVGSSPRNVTTGDFNHDGLLDFATVNTTSHSVSIVFNSRNSTSRFRSTTLPPAALLSPRDIEAVDVDGDGNLDLVVASYGSDQVVVMTGDGTGRFGAKQGATTDVFTSRSGPRTIATGDFNEDGRVDIFVGNQNSATITMLFNDTVFKGRQSR